LFRVELSVEKERKKKRRERNKERKGKGKREEEYDTLYVGDYLGYTGHLTTTKTFLTFFWGKERKEKVKRKRKMYKQRSAANLCDSRTNASGFFPLLF